MREGIFKLSPIYASVNISFPESTEFKEPSGKTPVVSEPHSVGM